uniref:Uncharacterized protein n=1 Tax=Kalanchoe fedtschenkoi TaxID=63787 RepID=A0A7N0ULP2_KALFE
MNTSSSDFSSGCESGWTTYLNYQSYSSSKSRGRRSMSMKMMCGDHYREEGENRGHGGGEDLSMVSDASSGPRQNNEEEEEEFFDGNECLSYRNSASEAKRKTKKNGKQRDGSQLDDTASSHSKNWQSSMYNNTAHGHESSAASLSKAKSSRKKLFGL